jgi:hypothetical protein
MVQSYKIGQKRFKIGVLRAEAVQHFRALFSRLIRVRTHNQHVTLATM